jgi:hypothetical protein
MWIGFKISRSATGKALTLASIMELSNHNGYRPERWNPMDICSGVRFIVAGSPIGVKNGKENLFKTIQININSLCPKIIHSQCTWLMGVATLP